MRAALENLSPLRSVRLSKAIYCNSKCVYHVLTQIVYNVTLDTMVAPTDKGGSICKNSAVLFTFWEFYGIIIWGSYLLDKLEFD